MYICMCEELLDRLYVYYGWEITFVRTNPY